MRRVFLIGLVVVIVISAMTAWVAVPVVGHLKAAQDAVSDVDADLSEEQLAAARRDLQAAGDRLDSVPAKILGVVPLLGSNLGAVRSVTENLIPVVDTARRLSRSLRALRKGGFIERGRVRVDDLQALHAPIADAAAALRRLENEARGSMTGAILPPLWNELGEIAEQARDIRGSLDDAVVLLRRSPALLGVGTPRRYLMLLLNNAELRGAGGILAGIGTLRFDNGKLSLEEMYSVHDLDVEPRITVPAPPTYERRYGQFEANTTLWLNATYSPDVPDVATVAARLFERVTGTKTSGAVLLDPRGLAALLDDDTVLELENFGEVRGDELPQAIYSDAYQRFTDQVARREAILGLGVAAFESFLDEGLPDGGTEALADAVAGGHLGIVSFEPVEDQALRGVGASHDLPAVSEDVVMVSVQNFGGGGGEGSKLDYWAKRATTHACQVDDENLSCATTVRLENGTPEGLTTYVAGTPYGLLRSYVEIFVPKDAILDEVRVDGRPADFRPDPHEDMLSLGVYVEVPRGRSVEISAVYRAPIDGGYHLVATPQALAHDARLSLALEIPDGWAVSGPGERGEDGVLRLTGAFDRPVEIEIAPEERKGLTALWHRLARFWNEPLF